MAAATTTAPAPAETVTEAAAAAPKVRCEMPAVPFFSFFCWFYRDLSWRRVRPVDAARSRTERPAARRLVYALFLCFLHAHFLHSGFLMSSDISAAVCCCRPAIGGAGTSGPAAGAAAAVADCPSVGDSCPGHLWCRLRSPVLPTAPARTTAARTKAHRAPERPRLAGTPRNLARTGPGGGV